jgi:hypothetical protein
VTLTGLPARHRQPGGTGRRVQSGPGQQDRSDPSRADTPVLLARRAAADQSAPSVVDELAHRIRGIRFDIDGRKVAAFLSVERISVETAQGILAENYAAYVAKWGEPA